MNKICIDLYGKTEVLPLNNVEGNLLYVEAGAFVDYSAHRLENGITIISPVKRKIYSFYLKGDKGEYYSVIVKLQTVYHNEENALKGNIELTSLLPQDIEELRTHATHLPKNKNNVIKFVKTKENGQIHYTVSIDGHFIGIVSEYGEYTKFQPDAEGMVFFDFDNEDLLVATNYSGIADATIKQFWQYQNLHDKAFPEYSGSIYSMQDREIIAASIISKNTFLIKAKRAASYWLLRPTPIGKLRCIGDPFEMHALKQNDLTFKTDMILCDKINEILVTKCEDVGKTLKIIRGFSVNSELGYNKVSIKDFYSCLYINEELITMYRHTN